MAGTNVVVGVLALQGSFREHMAMLQQIPGVTAVEVRTKEELTSVSGLIIPGGESTTMARIAEQWGLIPELQAFAVQGRPIWGTCAGMIFLAARAEGQKKGGQSLLGGLDICVSRNFFGAQGNSFEAQLPAQQQLQQYGDSDQFRAVFIRAPAVVEVGPEVEVLASYSLTPQQKELLAAKNISSKESVVVAVRQGPLMATAFHPELTKDLRWHQMFVDMVRQQGNGAGGGGVRAAVVEPSTAKMITRPADLPVFGKEFMTIEK